MVPAATPALVERLQHHAQEIRRDIVRMTLSSGVDHAGESLSITEVVAALVFHELRIDPAHPDDFERDRLVLSMGGAAPALYSALAHRGYFSPDELLSLGKLGSRLQGHVDRNQLTFIEASTGGLGQGIGMAVGMALDARIARLPNRVYAILGNDECAAGATWEALLAGGHYGLENLVVVLDQSRRERSAGPAPAVGFEPIADKFRALRYETLDIDGHDFFQVLNAFAQARQIHGRPTAIIARTVKGKGVSFLQEEGPGHGRTRPSKEELEQALLEIGANE